MDTDSYVERCEDGDVGSVFTDFFTDYLGEIGSGIEDIGGYFVEGIEYAGEGLSSAITGYDDSNSSMSLDYGNEAFGNVFDIEDNSSNGLINYLGDGTDYFGDGEGYFEDLFESVLGLGGDDGEGREIESYNSPGGLYIGNNIDSFDEFDLEANSGEGEPGTENWFVDIYQKAAQAAEEVSLDGDGYDMDLLHEILPKNIIKTTIEEVSHAYGDWGHPSIIGGASERVRNLTEEYDEILYTELGEESFIVPERYNSEVYSQYKELIDELKGSEGARIMPSDYGRDKIRDIAEETTEI